MLDIIVYTVNTFFSLFNWYAKHKYCTNAWFEQSQLIGARTQIEKDHLLTFTKGKERRIRVDLTSQDRRKDRKIEKPDDQGECRKILIRKSVRKLLCDKNVFYAGIEIKPGAVVS